MHHTEEVVKMKRTIILIIILLAGFTALAQAQWTSPGDYIEPYKLEGNLVTFKCTNAVVTVEVCQEDILRIRMSKSGNFLPNEPYVVIKYDWPKSHFTVKDRGDYIDISTQVITVKAFKSPFRIDIYDEDTRKLCLEPEDGGMGFDGDKVICRKKLTDTDHFFGLGQRFEKSDLRGVKYELWMTENITPIPFFMATDGYGIFFHNTWKSTFDFTSDPYSFSAPGGGEIDYYFFYGPSFKHMLDLYTRVTGKSPMPPKWAFGLIASKWGLQRGQEGILEDVKAARGEKNWPLDCIRVHAKNKDSGILASPKLNWPDDGWGAFDSPDKMVEQLNAMNCRVIFWECPGIPSNCEDKFQEGVFNDYFIMQDGEVWKGRFGYTVDPGAIVDFCNPEARKWWAQLHDFMIDFGSDGVAGDHGEEVYGTMYSPYNNMTGDELHNLYSMLYDMASWEAYKQRKPNKRSVVWGRSLWAGTQRYPMQGTQDSHSEGRNIEGEIMGCINFGLSGVPFRIYTDNVTREILDSQKTDWPLNRLSQYLSLTVAGERTELYWIGREGPDENYRRYGRLRYRLIPYIYSYVYETHKTGLPLVRAMVLEYQKDPATYEAYGQYLLGKELLIAPLWSDQTFEREIYLPDGKWIDFYEDTVYQGKQTITYDAPLDKAPILVKAGAIIPMAPDGQQYMDQKLSPMTVRIYPEGKSYFRLYEDDGISYDYEKGVYAVTLFKCTDNGSTISISKNAPRGSYKVPERDHVFRVHKKMPVKSATLDGKSLAKFDDKKMLDSAGQGWFNDEPNGIIWIKVKGRANKALDIVISK
jgi:alpha-glucosidase (family GH31 glycosyl hydrolase)